MIVQRVVDSWSQSAGYTVFQNDATIVDGHDGSDRSAAALEAVPYGQIDPLDADFNGNGSLDLLYMPEIVNENDYIVPDGYALIDGSDLTSFATVKLGGTDREILRQFPIATTSRGDPDLITWLCDWDWRAWACAYSVASYDATGALRWEIP